MKTTKVLLFAVLACVAVYACQDKLKVKTDYSFKLSTWYLPSSAPAGEPVEIRFFLDREGNFTGEEYFFTYIQKSGSGRLYDSAGQNLISREPMQLNYIPDVDISNPVQWRFTLFYESSDGEKEELEILISNMNGEISSVQLDFN